ncbi:MAG: signal peptide peptidase SppA [Myxococcales bacterium]|nr:signal peptide peptidase SppA [Myxococcales bacterium]
MMAGRFGKSARAAGAAGLVIALAHPAASEPLPPRLSDGVAWPSQSPVVTDTAAATIINPANLALMPAPEARLSAIYTGETSTTFVRGLAFDAASPFWLLGTGMRVELLDPPDLAHAPTFASNANPRHGWVRWGAAFRLGELGAFGTTLAWSSAESHALHNLFSITSGLTLRPIPWLGAAVVARDWNTPQNEARTRVGPSVDLALLARPFDGRKQLELGMTSSYRSDVARWNVGASLGVDVPHLGTLRGGVAFTDLDKGEVVASAGLDLNVERLQFAGGAIFGNAVTPRGTGFYASAALRSFVERPSVPMPARVVRIRFDATPNVRRHVRLLERLWKLSERRDVAGVLLILRAPPAPSAAHAEELVDALRLLKKRGKKVLCHLEDATARELFVCSEADRIAINPAGGVRFGGLAQTHLYFGGLLEKLGIRADFVRIGAHKLAPEQLTQGPTEVARSDHRALLDAYERLYVSQLARGRRVDEAVMRQNIATGPFIATEAREKKLVDALVYEDEIDAAVEESFGEPVGIIDLDKREEAPREWHAPARVAVVYLDGDMVDGESRDLPFVGVRLAGSRTVARALKQAREDSSVKAVVFRIETGGGSSLAADVILREASLLAKSKPLIVSMGSKAASGGYYVSVAAREIFANRATLTGSIGIFYGKIDVAGLLAKFGVAAVHDRTAPRADAESAFRPFTDDEREVLGRKVKQFYDLFVGRVAEGRKLDVATVNSVAEGRVWTGEQALTHRLVDRMGGLRQALERARELANLAEDTPIVELPAEEKTLFDRALELTGAPKLEASATVDWVPPPLADVLRALMPYASFAPDRPLARIEYIVDAP